MDIRWDRLREVVKTAADKTLPFGLQWFLVAPEMSVVESQPRAIRCKDRCVMEVAAERSAGDHFLAAEKLGLRSEERTALIGAADGALYIHGPATIKEVSQLREYILQTLQSGVMLLVLLLPQAVMAQDSPLAPLCSPYLSTCTPAQASFANVFVNVPGLPHTNLSIVNEGPYAARVEVTVTFMALGATEPTVIIKEWAGPTAFQPKERRDNFLTNASEWPELVGYSGGISVMVKSSQPLGTSVTIHPPVGPTYWTGAIFLEGK